MTEEIKQKPFRLPKSLANALERFAESKRMTENEIGILAIENMIKFDMTSEDWVLRAGADYEESRKRLIDYRSEKQEKLLDHKVEKDLESQKELRKFASELDMKFHEKVTQDKMIHDLYKEVLHKGSVKVDDRKTITLRDFLPRLALEDKSSDGNKKGA